MVDPVKYLGAKSLDLAQAPLCAPPPFCLPLVQHVEEPVVHDGVDLEFAAFCRAVAGLENNECGGWSGWRGRGGTGSADVRDLAPSCRRPHRQGCPSGGLVTIHGTRETQHHNVCRVLTAITKGSPRSSSKEHGAETMVSTTKTTDSRGSVCRDLLLHHSPALPEVRLDRRRQRGKLLILRHCDEWRTVCLAVLFVRFQSVGEISGRVILRLREVNDLAALRCTTSEKAELARSEPQDSWIGACFNFHHFDIESTLGAAGYPEPSFLAFV